MLPRWRGEPRSSGRSRHGDPVTGVQVMRMSEGLDEGPILMSQQVAIEADDTVASLHDKLAATGARLLPVALAAIERGVVHETPQAEDGVT
ncbi:formyltransferase family protein [Caulobacter segnis]